MDTLKERLTVAKDMLRKAERSIQGGLDLVDSGCVDWWEIVKCGRAVRKEVRGAMMVMGPVGVGKAPAGDDGEDLDLPEDLREVIHGLDKEPSGTPHSGTQGD